MLTFKALKELVPATKGRMPKPSTLSGQPILLNEEIGGAKIVIYKNGYLTYTVTEDCGASRTTVYSVHKCSQIVYQTGCSTHEFKEECGSYGPHCRLAYRVINGQLTRFAIISEEVYLDEPWWKPISIVCEERLIQNENSRFRSKCELRDNDDFDEEDLGPEAWLEAEIDTVNKAMDHERLLAALETLTEVQRVTVMLYFGNNVDKPEHLGDFDEDEELDCFPELNDVTEKMTERQVAKILGTTHQNVNKHLKAALKKLRKNFFN